MVERELEIGKLYKFIHTPTILVYMGYNWSGNGYWHQFSKQGEETVWSESLTSGLHLMEPVK